MSTCPNPSVLAVIIAKLICSNAFALPVLLFACVALFSIPFSPLNALIVTPANINSTIIVITNAISVIPLAFFLFVFIF